MIEKINEIKDCLIDISFNIFDDSFHKLSEEEISDFFNETFTCVSNDIKEEAIERYYIEADIFEDIAIQKEQRRLKFLL